MDGVLVDFAAGVASLFGIEKSAVEASGNEVHKAVGVSPDVFWASIDSAGSSWWETIPPCPWATRLLAACEAMGDVYVATSPPRSALSAATGKVAWLRRNLSEVCSDRRFFIGAHKHMLAAPDRLLVDDSPDKCADFRAAGGRAAIFPRPWNVAATPPGGSPWGLVHSMESGDLDGYLQ